MAIVAWFELIVGAGILGFWTFAVGGQQVLEIAEGDRAIFFHIAAEAVIGLGLVIGGVSLLASGAQPWSRIVAAAAGGGMVYSTINSPGHYARSGNLAAVAAFAALTVIGIVAIVALVVG